MSLIIEIMKKRNKYYGERKPISNDYSNKAFTELSGILKCVSVKSVLLILHNGIAEGKKHILSEV